jgi:hypothetical protein
MLQKLSDADPTARYLKEGTERINATFLQLEAIMNLAPNFPDDHTMHLLMQLLHEELGLPERKSISLTTSINFDLSCDGTDARHLMEALEEQFGIDLIDYDAYRYFQPEGFDVFLKRRAKGRGDKVPLTIGMLYKAIKAQRWDTLELEGSKANA